MDVLVTQPDQGVWRTPGERSVRRMISCPFAWPCAACVGDSCFAFACASARECLVLKKADGQIIRSMPCVPGISAMALSPCGRYLYQLSSEADCVHTRLVATGELLYAAPTGVFPRCMCPDETGRHLLVAGGAQNEAYLLSLPALATERVIHTRHPCFAACFCPEGMVLLCAAEGEDIHTAVYGLSARGVRPRLMAELPGQPGSLCLCPDGKSVLLSARDGLMKLSLPDGQLQWNLPEWALCMRMECRGPLALVSGTLDGRVGLISHQSPWKQRVIACGTAAEACFWE